MDITVPAMDQISEVVDCPELEKVVEGVLALHGQFEGPPRAYFESVRKIPDDDDVTSTYGESVYVNRWLYDRLESAPREEGETGETFPWGEAILRYEFALREYLKPYPSEGAWIVWRKRPEMRKYGPNQYSVYSRLVVL